MSSIEKNTLFPTKHGTFYRLAFGKIGDCYSFEIREISPDFEQLAPTIFKKFELVKKIVFKNIFTNLSKKNHKIFYTESENENSSYESTQVKLFQLKFNTESKPSLQKVLFNENSGFIPITDRQLVFLGKRILKIGSFCKIKNCFISPKMIKKVEVLDKKILMIRSENATKLYKVRNKKVLRSTLYGKNEFRYNIAYEYFLINKCLIFVNRKNPKQTVISKLNQNGQQFVIEHEYGSRVKIIKPFGGQIDKFYVSSSFYNKKVEFTEISIENMKILNIYKFVSEKTIQTYQKVEPNEVIIIYFNGSTYAVFEGKLGFLSCLLLGIEIKEIGFLAKEI